MNTNSVVATAFPSSSSALRALNLSAQIWFIVAAVGQLLFVIYIVGFYWLSAARGDFAIWSEVLPNGGLISSDFAGNFAMVTHILLAAVITFGGPLQLVPKLRAVAPKFHHWNGRVYIITAFVMAFSGLYMVGTRGTVGDWVQHTAISINAFLIIGFAVMALRNALAGNIAVHRRWAMRLFLVVSGVWFFRVGLMAWLAIHQKPVGIDFETFTGPFMYFLAFAQYLLPLLILELYLWAQAKAGAGGRWFACAVLSVVSLATGLGVVAASMGLWFPRIF